LAEILPTEENFLLLFRKDNPLESSVDFMRVWKQFDVDCSGYIEADELKQFVKTLLSKRQGSKISEEKLIEYTDSIVRKKLI
jgi:Ca2+-binding EF-hand superfamily protein